jgi:RNA polymerase sigma-70 factor (ECF subfamily)
MDYRHKEEIAVLARSIKASDEQAFSVLFHRTYPRLVKFAWRYTQAKPPAKDIVQESFIKLWEKRQMIDPNQSLMAYLFKIVRNQSLNMLRDGASANIALDDLPESALKAGEPMPDNNSTGDEPSQEMLGWIDQLPARQREAIRLSRFEGFDHEEIACIMNISPRTVNNHIVAALKTLRENWNDYKNTNTHYDSKKAK